MANRVVLDAGPLVSLVDRRDQFHVWALAQTKKLASSVHLVTCEAVLAEAFHLVRHVPGGAAAVLSFLEEEVIQLDFDVRDSLAPIAALMRRYADVPMSLADACLVVLSEGNPDAPVFTLDSHFRIYRRHGRQTIPLIFPGK
ncbi:MAG TPA: PIN domain-containing protein [Opitutaceae bacterium]|nr:PIN domain-containing protein [Opitutaceae bacterium]